MNYTTTGSVKGPRAVRSVKNRDFLLTFSRLSLDREILNWNSGYWIRDRDHRGFPSNVGNWDNEAEVLQCVTFTTQRSLWLEGRTSWRPRIPLKVDWLRWCFGEERDGLRDPSGSDKRNSEVPYVWSSSNPAL